MSMFKHLCLALFCAGGLAQAQFSFGGPIELPGEQEEAAAAPLMDCSAQASVSSYQAGKSFYLALQGKVSAPWHAYFRNPGTVGEAMIPKLEAPAGFEVKGPYWSLPHRGEGVVGVSYSYSDPCFVWELTPTDKAPAEATFSLSCTAQLCCDEGCNPPQTVSAELKLKQGDGAANAEWKQQQVGVEVLGDSALASRATQTVDSVTLHIKSKEPMEEAYFFSEDNSISPTAEQKLSKTADGYELSLPRNDNKDMMYPVQDESLLGKPLPALKGILIYGDKHSTINDSFAPAAADAAAQTPDHQAFFFHILSICGGLFLGGLILNLMPCVFPVLGLKVMSFVQLGGGDRRKVFLHAMAFVAGILISFWAISILLVLLKSEGNRSWAEWMQNVWVVYGILLLLLVLGLSMFGLFEIGVGATSAGQNLQSKGGLSGSFFQGLLVTVVATPCSAPYLGAAMPAAMALDAPFLVLALTFMALGLAFPYIVLALFPGLLKFLPQPGAWMESLKQGLSFLLFAAAAWMLDVYLAFWPESESSNTMWVLMSLVLIAAAFWVYGRWCPMYRSLKSRLIGTFFALLLLGIGVRYSMPYYCLKEPAAAQQLQVSHEWQPWTEAAMQKALAEGHPVYVDFTAKWCATCQANKKVAYTDAVYADFARYGCVLMRADKTRPNPEIDAAMAKLQRSSVPTNALYIPGKAPVITSELLTAPYLAAFLEEHLQGFQPEKKAEDKSSAEAKAEEKPEAKADKPEEDAGEAEEEEEEGPSDDASEDAADDGDEEA